MSRIFMYHIEAILLFKFLEKHDAKIIAVQEDSTDHMTKYPTYGKSTKEIISSLFACDDGTLYITTPNHRDEERWIRVIVGNDWGELVNDWCAFSDMDFMDKWPDILEELPYENLFS